MNQTDLINSIDSSLGEGVDAPRRAHFQIQNIMQGFLEQAQLEQAKAQRAAAEAEKATQEQQPKTNEE